MNYKNCKGSNTLVKISKSLEFVQPFQQYGIHFCGFRIAFIVRDSNPDKAEREMIARFSGDVLFSGDMTMLTNMLGGMEAKQRNAVIDFIADIFRYLKEKLSGNKQITLEIVRLERLFNEAVYDAAQSFKSESETSKNEKTTTEEISGSGEYSLISYSKHQIENWNKSKNIVIYKDEQQLRQFIRDAKNGVNLNKKCILVRFLMNWLTE